MWEDLNLQNPFGERFYGPPQLTVSASHAQKRIHDNGGLKRIFQGIDFLRKSIRCSRSTGYVYRGFAVAERAWIRTRGTRGCSRFQGECLKPNSAISPKLAEAERVERSRPKGRPASDGMGSPNAQRFLKQNGGDERIRTSGPGYSPGL